MRKYNITNYKINEDMSIDVIGDISVHAETSLNYHYNLTS
jgi:hypothetical protein